MQETRYKHTTWIKRWKHRYKHETSKHGITRDGSKEKNTQKHAKSPNKHKHANRNIIQTFYWTWVFGCRPRPIDLDLHPT